MARNQSQTFDYEAFLTPPKDMLAAAPELPPTILGMSDARASVVVPLLAYWAVSIFYETAHYAGWFAKYRVYPTGEEKRRNLVTRWETLRVVLVMHAVQLVFGLVMASILEPADGAATGPVWGRFGSAEFFGLELRRRFRDAGSGPSPETLWALAHAMRWAWMGLRQLAAFFVFDTWAYWVHYFEHVIPFLYRRIHSVHHYNYIPYSYAASYNHPIEGFFNDILGSYLSAQFIGLSDREAMVFFATASVKAVDDHASLELPWNPLNLWGWLFGNGMVHHNIHHQVWGLKTNFGLYFTFWDRVNNTIYRGNRRLSEAKEKWMAQHPEEKERKENKSS